MSSFIVIMITFLIMFVACIVLWIGFKTKQCKDERFYSLKDYMSSLSKEEKKELFDDLDKVIDDCNENIAKTLNLKHKE